ncbi:5'-phosphate synthase pdxT subunit [Arthrobacter roseus]|nr:5'-phosphate synthase pdxT subunit [Arthrobacter roseus]
MTASPSAGAHVRPETVSVRRLTTVGVLALQGDFREHAAAVTKCGAVAVPVRRPEDLQSVDGLIIPGGESTVMDKLSRIFGLAEPLRDSIASGLPVYGSCAGMIMLADHIADAAVGRDGQPQQTFGGIDMVVRRNAFGRQRESFETDLHFGGLERLHRYDAGSGTVPPVHAVFIRAPWVESVGNGVEVLASVEPLTESAAGQGPGVARIVAVRSGSLLATSFHPEVSGDRRIHELFIQMIRGES